MYLQCDYGIAKVFMGCPLEQRQSKEAWYFIRGSSNCILSRKALEFFDPDHSQDESRFIMLDLSYRLRVLVVCHCLRDRDSEIRIISARKARRKSKRCIWEEINEKRI
jgi:uncharacterized DUF497 family protein